eukprot:scaffold109133_cov28-Tisochrysis_lutea.AAC.6
MPASHSSSALTLRLAHPCLQHQDSLTHLRKTAIPIDLPILYRRLELLQSVASHTASHAASLHSLPMREPVGLKRAANIVSTVLSGGAGSIAAAVAGGGAISLDLYAAEPEVRASPPYGPRVLPCKPHNMAPEASKRLT